jgi:hypothetical protein
MSIQYVETNLFKLKNDGINYDLVLNYTGEKSTEELIELYTKKDLKNVNT